MKHLLGCVVALAVLAAECYSKGDYDHWRWWFLASTTDSATIALYDKIEDKYLHVSDLRVLREDLEPLYVQLSQSISNESEAQTAALLIRLFHYSAARPYKTAEYCSLIAGKLYSFNASSPLLKGGIEVFVDLVVAADLAASCTVTVEQYHQGIGTIDMVQHVKGVDARTREGSTIHLNRFRFLLQSIDGLTKFMAYNGVRDTATVDILVSELGMHLDTLDLMHTQVDSLPEWSLLLRYQASLKLTIYSDHNEYREYEDAVNQYAIATAASQYARMCFPESRLRGNSVRFGGDRSITRQFVLFAMSGSFDHVGSTFQILECVQPGFSEMFFDKNTLTDLLLKHPTQNRIDVERLLDSIEMFKKRYSRCFNHTRQSDEVSRNRENIVGLCSAEILLEQIMFDSDYHLRRLMVLKSLGKSSEVVSELAKLSLTSNIRSYRTRPLRNMFYWAYQHGLDDKLDSTDYLRFHVNWFLSEYSHSALVENVSMPLSTSASVFWNRLFLITSLSEMIEHKLEPKQRAILEVPLRLMLNKRGSITRATKSMHLTTLDSFSLAEHSSSSIRNKARNLMLSICENAPLTQFVSGGTPLSKEAVRMIESLSQTFNFYHQATRRQLYQPTSQARASWFPKDGVMYVSFDRHLKMMGTRMPLLESDSYQLCWRVTFYSSDTIFQAFEMSDSAMVSSLALKTSGVSYGVNVSTDLDSMIMATVNRQSLISKQVYTDIVFLPNVYLYAYNFYLIRNESQCLAERFNIRVTVGVAAAAFHDFRNVNLRMLMTRDAGIENVTVESEQIINHLQKAGSSAIIIPELATERSLAVQLQGSNVFHVASHARQPNLYSLTSQDTTLRELMAADDVGVTARRIWSPLIQYSNNTRDTGSMYADGYFSPLEMEVYGIRFQGIVFLSTCQTTTYTGDLWEPPDGILRELFTLGADCVVSSSIAVPDKYAAEYSMAFYRKLIEYGAPHVVATEMVREGVKNGSNVLSYGAYYPIYFETE